MSEAGFGGSDVESKLSVSCLALTVWRFSAANAVNRRTGGGQQETLNLDPLGPSPVAF